MRLPAAAASIACVLGVAACAPMQWVKEDASPAELQADMAACRQAAWRESWFRSWHYRPITPLLIRDAMGRPFYLWPHGPFYDPFYDPFLEESRLTQFCMESKGYRLVPVGKEKPVETDEPAEEKTESPSSK